MAPGLEHPAGQPSRRAAPPPPAPGPARTRSEIGSEDVLRDDGARFADELREAGVPVTHVTYSAIIHDFVMVNSRRNTNTANAAVAQAVAALKGALHA